MNIMTMSERERMNLVMSHLLFKDSHMKDAWYWKDKKPNSYQPNYSREEMQRSVNRAREANRQAVRLWYRREA